MSLQRTMGSGIATVALLAGLGAFAPTQAQEYWQAANDPTTEDYVRAPLPKGFSVQATELEGPVFADSRGMTLYSWPLHRLRNGDLGDRKGETPSCTDKVQTTNSGLMSPYPGGYELPELDTRPSCVELWPPVLAEEGAEPVGKWTIVERDDGSKQWAYDEFPLYTSVLDSKPGDVMGGTNFEARGDGPAVREPVGPPPNVPPSMAITQMTTGRMVVNHEGYAIYSWDGDEPNKSNCVGSCLDTWKPVLAPETANPQGEWTITERSPGIGQWTFRGRPLYTHVLDTRYRAFTGSDVPGWHNVFTQRMPAPPQEFTIQDARLGHVLADSNGRTIYVYNCGDDAPDQLACDNPDSPQAYRLAICGGGDPDVCVKTWPYVLASEGASSDSRSWSVITIDPKTGHFAEPGQAGALRVWAFRGRPVYTFAGDERVGETEGDAWGEFYGYRNGFKAFWLRDDFLSNAG